MANVKSVKKKKSPPRASRCPVSCSFIGCRSSLMHFSVRTHSPSRIVNHRQLQIFSLANISRVSAMHRRFPQITSLIIHTAWLSLAWTSTDLPPFSGICQRFIKTSRRVKNRAKIVQCELGIRNCLEDPKKHSNTTKTDNTLEMSILFKKGNVIMSTYGFSFHYIHS